ncbi:MAG: alpha/beta fold hydrolase [Maritimibacter sp.]
MMTPAPLHNDVAEGPEGGAAYWLTPQADLRIRIGLWPAQGDTGNTSGTIIMCPGRTEYIEKYGREAHSFTGAGFHFLAIDWRGQGLADRACDNRLLGHIDDYAEFQADLDAVLEAAQALDLPEPYYLIGHSMGGCIALRALHRNLGFRAAAFSAPMWGMYMGGVPRPIARAMTETMCLFGRSKSLAATQDINSYTVTAAFEDNLLTRDAEMFAYMKKQLADVPDFALGGPTNGWLRASLIETGALMASPAPKLPCLTFMGDNERIVTQSDIRDMMARWPNGRLEVCAGGEHEVMMEVPETRERVTQGIIHHFKAHL